ncbi:MAG: 1,4-dihydroxy-2-naphthoate octaprenyltransferase [Flavobacteriaceae bacterium]|nr:1,4-dihydroxy-2-naphthoate octaprenyltransferase [Flavobacteriaceae bacterium]|tara:strand:- start:2080 stop:2988 length:909 start_codon:yes stop_codon:yes gene_type:complete
MFKKISPWIKAARLRTIPLSVSGILIGSFATYPKDLFNIFIFLLAICTTISYQVLSNFANDFGDGIRGTDKNRIGPERILQSGLISRMQMKLGIKIAAFISFVFTVTLIIVSFKNEFLNILTFLFLGILAIFSAIKYTMGKNAYGYFGFGDFFVFIFFGIVSVLGSNYLFNSELSLDLLLPSLTIGCLSVGVLNLNNMRDLENDKKSKKNTIAVKLGPDKARIYHYFLICISMINVLIFHFKTETSSYFHHFFVIAIIIILIYHIFQVYTVSELKGFDKLLKPLVLTTFFYSIITSLNYIFN